AARIPSSRRFLLSRMDFTRPERCRQQRTGQEDRRSKFYETPDNLDHRAIRITPPGAGRPLRDKGTAASALVEAAEATASRERREPSSPYEALLLSMRLDTRVVV